MRIRTGIGLAGVSLALAATAGAEDVPAPLGTSQLYHFAGNPTASDDDFATLLGHPPVPSNLVATDGSTPLADLELGDHHSVVAPDGSVVISDWTYNVLLRISGTQVTRIAGNGQEGVGEIPLSGVDATSVPLDGPWGVDVAANGVIYFAEFQPSQNVGCPEGQSCLPKDFPHQAGRVLRLQGSTLKVLGSVPSPTKVKVGNSAPTGGSAIVYVASRNGFGTGGIHKLSSSGLPYQTPMTLLDGVDAEGIAVYEPDPTHRYLYVAAQVPPLDHSNSWLDAFVCQLDLNVQGGDCLEIQRFPAYNGGVPLGPLPDLYSFGGDYSDQARVSDIEVDTTGLLYLMTGYVGWRHWFPNGTFNRSLMFGGALPLIFTWRPGDPDATRYVGDSGSLTECIHEAQPSLAPPPDPVDGTQVNVCWGSSLALAPAAAGASSYFTERDPCLERCPEPPNYRSYEVRGAGAAGRPVYPTTGCGLGFELVLLAPLLRRMMNKRRA